VKKLCAFKAACRDEKGISLIKFDAGHTCCVLHKILIEEIIMNAKSRQKERKEQYERVLKTHPFQASKFKKFIYTNEEEQDEFGLINNIITCRPLLKKMATDSSRLFDEELDDFRSFLRSQLGKKNFNKLDKVFTK